ncbi:MAG: hypothetical protein Q9187_007152 [Circinaria calcarea]
MTKFESFSEPGFISVSSALKRFCGEMNQIKKKQGTCEGLESQREPDDSRGHLVTPRLIQNHPHRRSSEAHAERLAKPGPDYFFANVCYADLTLCPDCLSSLQNGQTGSRVEQVEETYGDTYFWLFSGRVGLKDWLQAPSSTHPIYWIQGKPGSGKSTLMKYAFKHKATKKLLKESHGGTWTLIPFFFHDRGFVEVQKTVESLLQELLFKFIFHHPNLVKVLYHIRLKVLESLLDQPCPGSADPSGLETQRVTKMLELYKKYCSTHPVFPWSMHKIEEAFRAIIEQNQITLRVCLFNDALDEHSGNHGKLVKMLKQFATKDSMNTVHIKLCLASRPAPIFTMSFSAYPGFAIHEHTETDIKSYAFGRIQSELTQDKGTSYNVQIHQLSTDIVKKVEGVFIWVRIVVDELVERIMDGDTIPQLLGALLAIPTELEDLYRQILLRIKPEYRRESYLIFQIMLSCLTQISLNNLMAVLDVALGGEVAKMPQENMHRRLHSRCGGLLETKPSPFIWPHEPDRVIVHFLHQTSKSFIQDTSNTRLLSEIGANISAREGRISLLQFCIHVVTEMDHNDRPLCHPLYDKMFEYARLLDSYSHTDFLVKTLDKLVLKSSKVQRRPHRGSWRTASQLANGLDVIKPAAPIGLLRVMLDPPLPARYSTVKEEDLAMLVIEWSITGLAQPKDLQPSKDWQPEDSQPEDSQPEDWQPEDLQPEGLQPEDSHFWADLFTGGLRLDSLV